MSGEAIDLEDLLGPDPSQPIEVLVDEAPISRPMGEASRALLERSRSYPIKPKKNTQERLQRLINAISENGVINSACLRAGISNSTLKYWLQKSLEGSSGDGFDMELGLNDEGPDGDTIRFHEAWDFAIMSGIGKLEAATMKRAMGYREVLTYQGRVIYQLDPVLQRLGFEGVDAYLLDAFGAPIPETVEKMDPDLAMFMLKARHPDYNPKTTVDMNVRGGVLVVPARMVTSADLNEIEASYRRKGMPEVTFDEGEDDVE